MSPRRLPVYLVLDCSGSMLGDPIEAVRQGVRALVSDLRNEPTALETAYLSVLTFADEARQVRELTELTQFQEPTLIADGQTRLGEALTLLDNRIEAEVMKKTAEQRGDWRPLVFLMTDGIPTDDWEGPADRLKRRKVGNVIACAAGAGAETSIRMLKRITENVVRLDDLQPESLKAFFRWVSDTITETSRSIATGGEGQAMVAPATPPQIHIVP